MVKLSIFYIVDSVAENIVASFYEKNVASAIRNYRQFLSKLPEGSSINDFILKIGNEVSVCECFSDTLSLKFIPLPSDDPIVLRSDNSNDSL